MGLPFFLSYGAPLARAFGYKLITSIVNQVIVVQNYSLKRSTLERRNKYEIKNVYSYSKSSLYAEC